ncbi:MAG: tetratricopeptide repeat protein [Alphaproteobacteria bacterium]|nr:tetratricopeptide repeat protein [Alphaproteobacteria bacterium]
MAKDALGHVVTTESAATIAAIDIYTADWIGYGTRLRSIFEAADADPSCALVNAQAAAVHMALEAATGFAAARPYLKRARINARNASANEQMFVAAVVAWSNGDTAKAMTFFRKLVEARPTDIATAKWAQYHAFNLGDATAMREIAETILPAHKQTPEAWGMLAFAHEQCHHLNAAEDAARRALSLKRAEPWAHHALAHVMDTQGRVDEGIEFLTWHSHTWADRSIFIREHNYWHLALLHLDRDEPEEALKIFDKHLWGTWPEFAQEQIGAISALWRLELRGVNVGQRWSPVVEQVLARWHEHVLPFHDLHFVYALARAGRIAEARAFIASLSRHGEGDERGVWDGVALPVAKALLAYAQGRFETAADLLGPQLAQLWRIGGSHAQRDVFVQTWIDAALRAGQTSAAIDVLARRVEARPTVRPARRLLNDARMVPHRIAMAS